MTKSTYRIEANIEAGIIEFYTSNLAIFFDKLSPDFQHNVVKFTCVM
jgi:hypothetical protein